MSSRLRRLAPGLLCLAIALLPWAEAGAQTNDAEKEHWQERYRKVRREYEQAKWEHEAALTRYKEAQLARRTGVGANRVRGEEREAVNAAVPETAEKLAEAEAALKNFPDLARTHGVPPGWLREVDDERANARLERERDDAIEERAEQSLGHGPVLQETEEAPAGLP